MLDILGTFAGAVLSLPGLLGLALGMTTRRPLVGCLLGVGIGVISTLLFAEMDFAHVAMMELAISVVVGAMAGSLGSVIRRHGATV